MVQAIAQIKPQELKGDEVYEKIKGWMDDDGGPLPCSGHSASCLGSGRD